MMIENMEAAQFTEMTEHNSKVAALFSPNGHAVANAVQSQLNIWNVESRKTSHKFECDNLIDFLKWSPDSELICCGKLKHSIQVWNLHMPHWRCKINGCLAFSNIYWAPNSRNLLVVSEFYVKITIFSLVSSVIAEIDNPKAIENCIVFSPCEKYLIVSQRINFEDYIGVYSCDTWEAIKIFPVETKNLESIFFSPTEFVIAISESFIDYKVLFYSIDGRLVGKYSDEAGFGLISLSWCSVRNIVAVGDYLGKVKILDSYNYEVLTSYEHPDILESTDITLYKVYEKGSEMKSSKIASATPFFELDEVIKNRPVSLLNCSPDNEKGRSKNPLKFGVQTLQFSKDGKYIATINGHMPKIVFVYNMNNFKLCGVIVRGSIIKNICWHPEKPYLIVCSSCNVLDIWTPECCIRYISPFRNDFTIISAIWSSKGDRILLNSRDHFSVLFFS